MGVSNSKGSEERVNIDDKPECLNINNASQQCTGITRHTSNIEKTSRTSHRPRGIQRRFSYISSKPLILGEPVFLLPAHVRTIVRFTWKEIPHRYRLASLVFVRILRCSEELSGIFLSKPSATELDIKSIVETPVVAAHIDRFSHFVDQLVGLIDSSPAGAQSLIRNTGQKHAQYRQEPFGEENFEIITTCIIDCVMAELGFDDGNEESAVLQDQALLEAAAPSAHNGSVSDTIRNKYGYEQEEIHAAWSWFIDKLVYAVREAIVSEHERRMQRQKRLSADEQYNGRTDRSTRTDRPEFEEIKRRSFMHRQKSAPRNMCVTMSNTNEQKLMAQVMGVSEVKI